MVDDDSQHNAAPEELPEASLMSHLLELRSRLLKAVGAILAVFLCLLPFTQEVFEAVARPLMSQLPKGSIWGDSPALLGAMACEDRTSRFPGRPKSRKCWCEIERTCLAEAENG